MRIKLFFLWLLCGCSMSSGWQMSSLATEDRASRLIYEEPGSSGFSLELDYANHELSGYLRSAQSFSHEDCLIDDASVNLAIHEGKMRARLPDEITKKIVSALQNGQTVTISLARCEQKFEPQNFSHLYQKMIAGKADFPLSLPGRVP